MGTLIKKVNSNLKDLKSDAPLVVESAQIRLISHSVALVLMVSRWTQPIPAKNAMIFA